MVLWYGRMRLCVATTMAWYGMVWYGMVWYGMVWYGMIWYAMAFHVGTSKANEGNINMVDLKNPV